MEWNTPLFERGAISSIDVPFGSHEKFVLRQMLAAFIVSRHKNGRFKASEEFLQWYHQHASDADLRIAPLDTAARKAADGKMDSSTVHVRFARTAIPKPGRSSPRPSALQKRLDWVVGTLRLDQKDAQVLAMVCRLTQIDPFRSFASAISGFDDRRDEVAGNLVGSLLGLRGSALKNAFSPRGHLMQLGLIEDRGADDFAPSEMLLKLLRQDTTDPRSLEDALIGEPVKATLKLSDFDHLGRAREDVIGILGGSLGTRAEGVGFLFYGPPGTGKTEFAALLGEALDARVVFAGEMDEDDLEPNRADRLAHLSLLSAIGHRAGRLIVVVDEADDIFTGVDDEDSARKSGSKVFVNRLVERCTVPTIWITNHPERFGDAVLRRMVRAVEFRKPGTAVRRRIVERHAAAFGVDVDRQTCDSLARLSASPAVIASSLKAASLGAGGGAMALSAAMSIQKALKQGEPVPRLAPPIPFDASLSSADVDLEEMAQRVEAASTTALSFLFTGLPGTGKTAYARHLAERLGMDVLQKKGSDLLSMYVGQTEAKIAEAFQEAAETNTFLIFDEADSLLFDRRAATRSWELSQVNEMLTWMESHPLPFAATSNLMGQLDPAVMRRFIFKARFNAMSPAQIDAAFERHFGRQAPGGLRRLDNLTPGDFAVVSRKAGVLGVDDPARLAEMLESEATAKPGAARQIGF